MSEINIAGLNRVHLVLRLIEAAKPSPPELPEDEMQPVTLQSAANALEKGKGYVGISHGRLVRVDLSEDRSSFNPDLYDQHNGRGAARRVVKRLR